MFSKRSIAAVFAVAVASSLIVVIGSSFIDSAYAFAAAKEIRHSTSVTSHVLNAAGWDRTFGNDSGVIAKEVDTWREECNDA